MSDWSSVPDEKKVWSTGGQRALAWWIARGAGDSDDGELQWAIQVWDVASKRPIETFHRWYEVEGGLEDGEILEEVVFADDGSNDLILRYRTGRTERQAMTPRRTSTPPPPAPPILLEALERAETDSRFLFAFLFAGQCPHARAQDDELAQPQVAALLDRCFQLRVDTLSSSGAKVAHFLQHSGQVGCYVLSPAGRVVARLPNFKSADVIARSLEALIG